MRRKHKNVLMYNESITLWDYCYTHNIPYYRIVYRLNHNKDNLSIDELLKINKGDFTDKTLYFVNYKGQRKSLDKALKEFYNDLGIFYTTHSSNFTKKSKKSGVPLQEVFDDYCQRKLKLYGVANV